MTLCLYVSACWGRGAGVRGPVSHLCPYIWKTFVGPGREVLGPVMEVSQVSLSCDPFHLTDQIEDESNSIRGYTVHVLEVDVGNFR